MTMPMSGSSATMAQPIGTALGQRRTTGTGRAADFDRDWRRGNVAILVPACQAVRLRLFSASIEPASFRSFLGGAVPQAPPPSASGRLSIAASRIFDQRADGFNTPARSASAARQPFRRGIETFPNALVERGPAYREQTGA